MKRERLLDVFVFFDGVFFREVDGFFDWCKAAAIFFKDSSIVAAEEPVFVGISIIRPPREIKKTGEFKESLTSKGNGVSDPYKSSFRCSVGI